MEGVASGEGGSGERDGVVEKVDGEGVAVEGDGEDLVGIERELEGVDGLEKEDVDGGGAGNLLRGDSAEVEADVVVEDIDAVLRGRALGGGGEGQEEERDDEEDFFHGGEMGVGVDGRLC